MIQYINSIKELHWQPYSMGKEKSFQQTVQGKVDIHMHKNEVTPLLYTTY